MTYCLAIRLDQGLVFGSDARTNAGADYVTTYRKMHIFQPADDRTFVVLSAGSLATTQEIGNHIRRDLEYPTGETNLANVRYLFEAAEYIGNVSQRIQASHQQALSASGFSGETSLILGGRIEGQPHDLMLIYPQGNYITVSEETPYLQIGESKYGKPILDRFLSRDMSLERAALVALISLEGTAQSNLTVGPPFDVALFPHDTTFVTKHMRFELESGYLTDMRSAWQQGLQRALDGVPPFDWSKAETPTPIRPGAL